MNKTPSADVPTFLAVIARQVRWLRTSQLGWRMATIAVGVFALAFAFDLVVGLRTLSLRVIVGGMAGTLAGGVSMAWLQIWRSRLDPVGLAHLLEQRHPELAERLVTLVQLPTETPVPFARFLAAETGRQLSSVNPQDACSLDGERQRWLRSLGIGVVLLTGLCFWPAFTSFSQRCALAWFTPLVPFAIEVAPTVYAVRGGEGVIRAKVIRLDPHAPALSACTLCPADSLETGEAMTQVGDDQFTFVVPSVREPSSWIVRADDVKSNVFALQPIDPPSWSGKPSYTMTPPKYVAATAAQPTEFESATEDANAVLQFSRLHFSLPLDRKPIEAMLEITSITPGDAPISRQAIGVTFTDNCVSGQAEWLALKPADYRVTLRMTLEHELIAVLPMGVWRIHEDQAPRLVQPLTLRGVDSTVLSRGEYRISPQDTLRLQTEIADDEGLDQVEFEYRLNDQPAITVPWLRASGKKSLVIDDWLPLPDGLKESDRVQFRIRVSDNRALRRGEVVNAAGAVHPERDLSSNVAYAPAAFGGEDAWVTLRVNRSIESFLKDQAEVQAREIKNTLESIKQKINQEIVQVRDVQRSIHQQAVLTPAQIQQVKKIRTLNSDIIGDLFSAGERFARNPELAGLADRFFGIAETDLTKSGNALERVAETEKSFEKAERELQTANDALLSALKKLDQLQDLNKLLAQDRLDQFQMEKLAKRQQELADRLAKLLAESPTPMPMGDAEMTKRIDALREEQAKIANEMAKLEKESRLVQESHAVAEQMKIKQLAADAKALAQEQREQSEIPPEKMSPAIKERLKKLAERQAALADDAQPFAKKHQGPNLKPADEAAESLRRLRIEPALNQQKEHERRLREWLEKLLPGQAVNAIRERVMELAKEQKQIAADLEKLGADLGNLNEVMVRDRLGALVKRQAELADAVAKLPTGAGNLPQRDVAGQTALKAARELAVKDALAAHETMEKTKQLIDGLAQSLPKSLPTDRNDIKDPVVRDNIDRIERFEKVQQELRADTERLLADLTKMSAGGGNAMEKQTEKLAGDLMELAQKATSPEAKAMANESAKTLDDAKKAMQASDALKAKGEAEQAKKMDADAAGKLELAVKQLQKMVQEQAGKDMPKPGAEKTAESLKKAADDMRRAEKDLPTMPKDAEIAMKSAAKQLMEAAQQASEQTKRKNPVTARKPAAKVSPGLGRPGLPTLPKDIAAELIDGKTWGELPGELRTRMLQDFRGRFGDDYAELIQRYFERIAETPGRKQ